MMKVLIADDEPLVQIGVKSMIDWESMGLEICGTASNGDVAWNMILEYHPEIVIADIQMPCCSGLELGKRCMEELGRIPVFLILTSYEEFSYAREAISFHAVDYLVKIDLTPETLSAAVQRAADQVKLIQKQQRSEPSEEEGESRILFQEQFFIRLLNNLFETPEQYARQMQEFQISLDAPGYAAAHMEFLSGALQTTSDDILHSYRQTLHMFEELLRKYLPCYTIPLDTHYFAVVFLIEEEHMENWLSYISDSLEGTCRMLRNYYNVTLYASIGRMVTNPLELSTSYYDAKQLNGRLSEECPILFWDEVPDISSLRNVFNLSLFRNDIVRAFEELDPTALKNIMDEICQLLSRENIHYSQALDAASSILHLSINLLSNGTEIVNEIFAADPDSYRSLYRKKNVASIIKWLRRLEAGLCDAFSDDKRCRRHYLVDNCCKYINEHISQKISLQDIADTFGVSPNYMGQLFKKHMDIGISEYITNQKVNEAKGLLKNTSLKIYEISDQLGFEDAFYFSKVFKKNTGMSPKDYRNT